MADIIVIGGGPAGLYASHLLAQKHNVTILEAAPFAGGRIRTFYEDGLIYEGGAEFIHGNQQITMMLAEEANLHWHPFSDNFFRNNGNGPEPAEMVDGMDKLIEKMKAGPDETLSRFLLKNEFPSNVRDQALLLCKSFSLADPEETSIKYLSDDWGSLDEDQFFLEEGYNALVMHLVQKCENSLVNIIYNCRAERIEWKFREAKIYTTGRTFEAEKVLITTPINRIGKIPGIQVELDEKITNALACFGYGPTIKTIMEFKNPFWPDEGFYLSNEEFATWWTHPKYKNRLTGWMDEANARKANVNENELLNSALSSLSALFSIPRPYLEENLGKYTFYNWQSGAYSFGKPGFAEARKILAEPLEETIYFAGEAFQNKVTGATVEAAFVSAENAAGKM